MAFGDFHERMKNDLEKLELPEEIWVALSPSDRPRYYQSEKAMTDYFKFFTPKALELYKFAKYRIVPES